MNIKIEPGAKVQITDKPIINVFGDVVQHKEEHIHYDAKSSSFSEAEEAEFEEVKPAEPVADSPDRIIRCILKLKEEKVLKRLFDYTWVMEVMNQTKDLPKFNTPTSFITYLKNHGIERVPSEDTIEKKQNKLSGTFPNWEFTDCDTTEAMRRINVAKRFLVLLRNE